MKLHFLLKSVLAVSSIVVWVGCDSGSGIADGTHPPEEGFNWLPTTKMVVKSTFSMNIVGRSAPDVVVGSLFTSLPVTVVNAVDAEMTVDTKDFAVPVITTDVLSFGKLAVSQLKDNNLKVCGSNGKTKCAKAFIRIYTTGVAGEGLYNSTDGYGAPIMAGLSAASLGTVGLGPESAAIVQMIPIPNNKNVLRLSDFSTTPIYEVLSDFTNAGAGTYGATLVMEYGLSL